MNTVTERHAGPGGASPRRWSAAALDGGAAGVAIALIVLLAMLAGWGLYHGWLAEATLAALAVVGCV